MKRNPVISQGQINKGLCGIKGCSNKAGRFKIVINGEKIPACSEHRKKRLANTNGR